MKHNKWIIMTLTSLMVLSSIYCSSCKQSTVRLPVEMEIEKLMIWKDQDKLGFLMYPDFIHEDIAFFVDSKELLSPKESLYGRTIYRNQLFARSLPDGKLLWKSPERFNGVPMSFNPYRRNFFFGLAFAKNALILQTTKHELVALSLPDFKEIWTHQAHQNILEVIGSTEKAVFYLSKEHELRAISLENGQVLWKLLVPQEIRHFQELHQQRIVLAMEKLHELWIINSLSGVLEWKYDSPEYILHRSICYKDEILYFLTEKNKALSSPSEPSKTNSILHALDTNKYVFRWTKELKSSFASLYSDEKVSFFQDTLFLPKFNPIQLQQSNGKEVTPLKMRKYFEAKENKPTGSGIVEAQGPFLYVIDHSSNGMMCYDLLSNRAKWQITCYEVIYGPVLIQNRYLFVSDRPHYRDPKRSSQHFLIEVETGAIVWKGETEEMGSFSFNLYFNDLHWNTLVFPDREQAWDLAPIIQAWEARKP